MVSVANKVVSLVFTGAWQISYPMSKRLNTSEFSLEENEHFNYIDVNVNQSTVHVPTNVYEQCTHFFSSSFLITSILDFNPRDLYYIISIIIITSEPQAGV